ncbi:MAG: NFACT family protein [Planctomycetota bacterium]|nr:NFACT family protein [Planctomycetota bacterium]
MVGQLKKEICPSRLEQVYQIAPTDITWKLSASGKRKTLLFSAHPSRSRIHLLTEPPDPPDDPPDFARSLRRHLVGGILTDIEQVSGDRIVRVSFQKGSDRLVFVAELMGRGSHLLLLDENDEILAALRRYRGKQRTLAPRLPYAAPAAPAQPKPSAVRPYLLEGDGPSRLAEVFYRDMEREAGRLERIVALRKFLGRARRKAAGTATKIRSALTATEMAGQWQRMGEALKASLGKLRKGMKEAVVPDPHSSEGGELRIPLDPAKGPVENMNSIFRTSRKLRRGRVEIEKRLAWAEAEVGRVQSALDALEIASDDEAVTDVERDGVRHGWFNRPSGRKRAPARRQGHRKFFSRDGLEIWVGRTDRENDVMTFRHARGDDLFLHVDGRPGSHVIVRLGRGREVPQETLLEAAELAAHFSSAREHEKVEVIYTPRKHVRRSGRGHAGQVTIARERRMLLRRDTDRLGRVLSSVRSPEEVPS